MQQQQAQKAAGRKDASKVSPLSHDIEVTTKPYILVVGFLNVLPLAGTYIRKRPIACAAASAADAASGTILPLRNAATISRSAASSISTSCASHSCTSKATSCASHSCTSIATSSASGREVHICGQASSR